MNMKKATEARIATEARLEVKAKEFIINNIAKEIENAINKGWFSTQVDVFDLDNYDKVAPKAVEILENEYGYRAEYKVEDGYRSEIYINIYWDDAGIRRD